MNTEKLDTILCIVGARPNFMKIAPVMAALEKSRRFEPVLVHTGQHYDSDMKHRFFTQLNIPEPDVDLEVGSGSHAVQTAEIMKRFETVLDRYSPKAILVVGDVNSTIACALVASKKHVTVIHVEAGLRSYDRGMPEEINRVLTDQISDYLFTTERDAESNLAREGISSDRIFFVGNVMIDTLLAQRDKAVIVSDVLKGTGHNPDLVKDGFVLLTMHRPSNVDSKEILEELLNLVKEISTCLPVIFPVHPRTKARIDEYALDSLIFCDRIITTAPLGYHEMLGVMQHATAVITDSGGIQEETTALGVPCITLRENTERPITITEGTNTIAGTNRQKAMSIFRDILDSGGKAGRVPEKWDGKAAERIVSILEERL